MKVKTNLGVLKAKKAVLNEISIVLRAGAEHYEKEGYTGLSAKYRKAADEIYNALDVVGFFDDIRNKDEEVQ